MSTAKASSTELGIHLRHGLKPATTTHDMSSPDSAGATPQTSPAVSVVVPCWNAGQFLDGLFECLDKQTFENFEVIVVDDGSTEPETLKTLSALPASVRLVRQENRGLPSARNTGFRSAKGEFVLPLDCDDRIQPEFLALGVATLEANRSIDFVFSHMLLTGARQGVVERSFNPFDQLFLNQLPYALLMRKAAWERVGGYDESMTGGYEDWDFNMRLIRSGSVGQSLKAPLFVYRVAGDGMLLQKSARRHGELWRRIRNKHPQAYRLSRLMQLRRESGPGKVSLTVAAALLTSALLLPDRIFGALFHRALASRAR
ncbi:glycosyltransferase family A protein [Hyphomicrobium sp.]|uniref:glycosyltransferase family A protein n=1 Tax=Hyphomicrobium sp. TaxID=82 RepID=UPI0025C5CE88|nr:glycosyltransferase family A protein [Hyphomicrobium sp.]MCC7251529.1 glycosyltransferase family 2 protein [Hyphomicrobium sp.]